MIIKNGKLFQAQGAFVDGDLYIEGDKIDVEIHCTKNHNNTELTLDYSKDRLCHNDQICKYLNDIQLYKKCYEESVNAIICKQYIRLIDGTFYDLGFKSSVMSILRMVVRWIRNDSTYNKRILEYIGNKLYNSALLTYFNKK